MKEKTLKLTYSTGKKFVYANQSNLVLLIQKNLDKHV